MSTPFSTGLEEGTTKRGRLRQRWWIKPAIGVTLLAAILLAGPVYGRIQASGKIDSAIDRDADRVDITVQLPFVPENYHRETLSDLGVFAGRDGDTRIRLRAVEQDDLDTISRLFWVESIEQS